MHDGYIIVCRFVEGAIKEESKGGRRKECSKKYIYKPRGTMRDEAVRVSRLWIASEQICRVCVCVCVCVCMHFLMGQP